MALYPPNIEGTDNSDVVTGGVFGAIIDGVNGPASVNGTLTVNGDLIVTGSTTAPTSPGAFTTLTASSTVSGTGFTARFASPGPIGSTVASTGNFTTLDSTGAFGCNSAAAQTPYASGGPVVATPSSLTAYGYTEAQADAIVTLLNSIQAALVANGIMS